VNRHWLAPGLLILFMFLSPDFQGDSETLIRNAQTLKTCILAGQSLCPDSGVYALFQQLIALPLVFAGLWEAPILNILAHVSTVFLLLTLGLFWKTLEPRSRSSALIGILVMITGNILTYGRSTYGEMAAAFLITGLISSLLRRKSPLEIAAWVFFAGLTKDTALPFLGLLAATSLLLVEDRRRSVWLALAGGATLTALLTMTYNFYRFRSVFNQGYLNPEFIVSNLRIQASSFAAIWFSPSGGLLFFWPTFVLTLILCAQSAFARRRLPPLLSICFALGLLTYGFSKWYAPLGWWSWGPRLMIPWVPATLLILLWSYGDSLENWTKGRWFKPVAVFALFASLPQFLYFFHPEIWYRGWESAPGFQLPPNAPSPVTPFTAPELYFGALSSAFWKPAIVPLELYAKPYAAWQIALILAYLWVLVSIARKLRSI
jgi:hypothetical protein